jgi:hypothetical protein
MEIDEIRFTTLALLGDAIRRFQELEDIISKCYLCFSNEVEEDGEVFFQFSNSEHDIAKRKKLTLGRLVSELKKRNLFSEEAVEDFERFVEDRNRLVHRIFKEDKFQELDDMQTLSELQTIITDLTEDTHLYISIFDAFLGLHIKMEFEHGHMDDRPKEEQEEMRKSFDDLWNSPEEIEKRKELSSRGDQLRYGSASTA